MSEAKACRVGLARATRCSHSGRPMASIPARMTGARNMTSVAPLPEEQVAPQRFIQRLIARQQCVLRACTGSRRAQSIEMLCQPLLVTPLQELRRDVEAG